MQHVSFRPKGVCASQIDFDIDDENRIRNLAFIGGCNGNLKAIGLLAEGQNASNMARLLRGNDCAMRGTSCADQFARAIEEAV